MRSKRWGPVAMALLLGAQFFTTSVSCQTFAPKRSKSKDPTRDNTDSVGQKLPGCPLPEKYRPPVPASLTTQDGLLASLNPQHPRIWVTPERLEKLRRLLATQDAGADRLLTQLKAKVEEVRQKPPITTNQDGSQANRLLSSPDAAERILTLAGHYLLTENQDSAEAAIQVMRAAAAFPDWHPGHFLDTSVMAYGMAVGYDWLFDRLSPKDRDAIRAAIIDKSLKPALKAYETREWWTTSKENWPLVNGGGIGVAALAVAESEPQLATTLLRSIGESFKTPLANLEPDGGWPEGLMYWNYGLMYFFGLTDALQTALGTDWNWSESPGLRKTGYFRIHGMSPAKKPFSYYDTGEGLGSSDFMLWMTRQYQDGAWAAHEDRIAGLSGVRALLWYHPGCLKEAASPPETTGVYPRLGVVMMRTSWDNPSGIYLGFKGGDNRTPHGHLDLGSFVADGGGERWFVDLGADAYTVPGYFSDQERSKIYRISTQGHNTLTMAQERQKPLSMPHQALTAVAPLKGIRKKNQPDQNSGLPYQYAVVDLTEAYAPLVRRAWRGLGLTTDRSFVLVDEVESAGEPLDVVAHFHTRAKIVLEDRTAILTQGSRRLVAQVIEPANATFDVISANPRDANPKSVEHPNTGVRDLVLRPASPIAEARFVIRFTWQNDNDPAVPDDPSDPPPLAEWVSAGMTTAE